MENSRRRVLLATLGVLFLRVASAEQISTAPAEQMAPPITVRASSSLNGAASEFLTAFISTAVRFDGAKFISCLATAVKLRPDLAGKLVLSALNISRISAQSLEGRLSCATIDQIIKAAVGAAPKTAPTIVKAAIKSELFARRCIIAAAIAAAPEEEAEIRAAANDTPSMSILPLVATFNPMERIPADNVNSPEQPPAGP